MNLLLPHHSSAADWDIDGHWSIATDHFVSPPSSLKHTVDPQFLWALYKALGTIPLNQGRVITSFRAPAVSNDLLIPIRDQSPVGSVQVDQNLYVIHRRLDGTFARVYGYQNGGYFYVGTFGAVPALTINTWYQFRATFWESWAKLRFRLERFIAPDWIQEGSDLEDPNNLWSGSLLSRCGIGAYAISWLDDTEIWGP